MSRLPFLQKLYLRNFRSIQDEAIVFPNPLFLVGRNDTGKTNVLEALSFLSDCMSLPLQTAVDSRGASALSRTCMRSDSLTRPRSTSAPILP